MLVSKEKKSETKGNNFLFSWNWVGNEFFKLKSKVVCKLMSYSYEERCLSFC